MPQTTQSSRQSGRISWSMVFNPSGCSSRSQFALVIVPHVLIGLSSVSELSNFLTIVAKVYWIPGLYIGFVAVIRRLHDLGRSGWWSLLMFVPLVNFVSLIYLLFAKGGAFAFTPEE